MIEIICVRKNKLISKIEIKGHANANDIGKDIVCAGVSSIVLGAIVALKGFNEKEISSKNGNVKIEVKHKITTEDNIRLEMMLTQLKLISSNYPKNVKIKKE